MSRKFQLDPAALRKISSSFGARPNLKPDLKALLTQRLSGVANPTAINVAIDDAFANVGGGGICAAGITPLARRNGIPDVKGYGTTGGGAKGAGGAGAVGITVTAASGVIDTFLTAANWQGASSSVAFRKFLLGDDDPKVLDPIYRNCPLERVEAYVEVYAGPALGSIDRDLSQSLTGLFERNFAIVVDPDGLSNDFQLAPTFLADMPVGGIAFDPDNQPIYDAKGFVRVDYCGVGELQEYLLADHSNGVDITMSVYFTVIGHFNLSAKRR